MIKEILTTGEVGKYCHVNFRTVIRWVERGMIESYKLPGRGDNRIHTSDLVKFLQENNMPIHQDLLPSKVLICVEGEVTDALRALAASIRKTGLDPVFVNSQVRLGYLIAKSSPAAIIVTDNCYIEDVANIINISVEPQYKNPKIILLSKKSYKVIEGVSVLIARDTNQALGLIAQGVSL